MLAESCGWGAAFNPRLAALRTGQDEEFLREYARLVLRNKGRLVEAVQDHMERMELASVGRSAEELKGIFRNLAACHAFELACALQERAEAGDVFRARQYVAELVEALGQLVRELSDWLEVNPLG